MHPAFRPGVVLVFFCPIPTKRYSGRTFLPLPPNATQLRLVLLPVSHPLPYEPAILPRCLGPAWHAVFLLRATGGALAAELHPAFCARVL